MSADELPELHPVRRSAAPAAASGDAFGDSPFAAVLVEPTGTTLDHGGRRVAELLDRLSERLNPIVVKEARQALKSRQFAITFSLLLIGGLGWSLVGVAILLPGVYFAPSGAFMLSGYFLILAAPAVLIVPFTAFRSLAGEREDGTFELLSITALNARQIVTGKLAIAIVQMLVYYSALAPCLAFTYLLRGVDIVTIAFVLFHTFLAAVLLSSLGLAAATVSRARHWQVATSVGLLLLLVVVLLIWLTPMFAVVTGEYREFDQLGFWLGQAALFSVAASFAALFVLVAAAQISFASDNRSTPLRIMMVGQQVLWLGWCLLFWLRSGDDDLLYVTVVFAGLYWFVAGALMMGELPQLSPRVKRALPSSFLGRACWTWFNPGSGTGYVFATTNMLAVALFVLAAGAAGSVFGFGGSRSPDRWTTFTMCAVGYLAAYLGAGRLAVLLLRRIGRIGPALSLLVNVLIAVLGWAGPFLLQAWLVGYDRLDYSPLQAASWGWTLVEAADNGLVMFPSVKWSVVSMGVALFVINLQLALSEFEQVRTATPNRVLDDDRQHAPVRTAAVRHSPWDDQT